mmetsp:Transcript_717/g.1386  ORF Transcript_717/g.1386 Transcript_717/m.1386 type:complete len:146 (+) Transcript_717:1828-2265(+)
MAGFAFMASLLALLALLVVGTNQRTDNLVLQHHQQRQQQQQQTKDKQTNKQEKQEEKQQQQRRRSWTKGGGVNPTNMCVQPCFFSLFVLRTYNRFVAMLVSIDAIACNDLSSYSNVQQTGRNRIESYRFICHDNRSSHGEIQCSL